MVNWQWKKTCCGWKKNPVKFIINFCLFVCFVVCLLHRFWCCSILLCNITKSSKEAVANPVIWVQSRMYSYYKCILVIYGYMRVLAVCFKYCSLCIISCKSGGEMFLQKIKVYAIYTLK